MLHPLDDTIAAIASAGGGAARGVLRISGPHSLAIAAVLFDAEAPQDLTALAVPSAVAGRIRVPPFAVPIAADLLVWPGPRSYTGQPAVEIHTLGSPPILEALLAELLRRGARLAQPGEFTLRAFLAGRIDLTQAEAVLGAVDALDRRELDVALAQMAGGLAGPLHALRDRLVDLLSHLEAGFDFADEDIAFIAPEELRAGLDGAAAACEELARRMTARGHAGQLPRVVLVGEPNVGKSSLFNALAGREHAIVSRRPGTTRDYLVAELDLDGVGCRLIDTAGVESAEGGSSLAAAAQEKTREQVEGAGITILCLAADRPRSDWEREQLRLEKPDRLAVLTKADAVESENSAAVASSLLATSAATGRGLPALRARLRQMLESRSGDVVAATAVRCRESLAAAGEALRRGRALLDAGEELAAAELRAALDEMGKVVGAFYTDDLLERIFSRFCVGK